MERISWDKYNTTVREALVRPETMFKRGPLVTARKYAKRALEKLAREYNIDYNQLLRSLMEQD